MVNHHYGRASLDAKKQYQLARVDPNGKKKQYQASNSTCNALLRCPTGHFACCAKVCLVQKCGQLAYNLAMNNPRGTYMNKSTKPNSHLTSAHVDRPTYNNNTSVSKQQAEKSTQSLQDKMITKILEVVGKLENPTNTPALSRETLKTGSNKAFFDVLCIFFRAIDGHTERAEFNSSSTNTELMQDALRVFGYKGNYNRSLFQPIGAPHTWTQCLTILEWFSQLAAYSYSFQGVLQERVFEEDQHSLTLNTFSTRKDELVTNFINSQTEHLEGQITTNSYIVESKQMAIRNQHAAQKELPLVIRELDKEKELAYRAKQELAGAEAEVRAVELKIEAKQEELAQSQEKVAEGQSSLEKIRYEIIHQQLPPEECEKLKLEIRDTKNKISEIEEGISETIDIQKSVNKDYLENITDRTSALRKLAEKLTGSALLHESDVKLQIPTLSPMELNDLLRMSFQEWALDLEGEARLETIFKEREFVQFFRKQEQLIAKYQARFGREEEALVNKQQQLQSLDFKCRDFQENIDRLDRSKKAKLSKSSLLHSEKNQLERAISELEAQIHLSSQEIAQKTLQKEGLMHEVKEGLADLQAMKQAAKECERGRAQSIRKAKERLEKEKHACLEKIDAYKKALNNIFSSSFQNRPENQ